MADTTIILPSPTSRDPNSDFSLLEDVEAPFDLAGEGWDDVLATPIAKGRLGVTKKAVKMAIPTGMKIPRRTGESSGESGQTEQQPFDSPFAQATSTHEALSRPVEQRPKLERSSIRRPAVIQGRIHKPYVPTIRRPINTPTHISSGEDITIPIITAKPTEDSISIPASTESDVPPVTTSIPSSSSTLASDFTPCSVSATTQSLFTSVTESISSPELKFNPNPMPNRSPTSTANPALPLTSKPTNNIRPPKSIYLPQEVLLRNSSLQRLLLDKKVKRTREEDTAVQIVGAGGVGAEGLEGDEVKDKEAEQGVDMGRKEMTATQDRFREASSTTERSVSQCTSADEAETSEVIQTQPQPVSLNQVNIEDQELDRIDPSPPLEAKGLSDGAQPRARTQTMSMTSGGMGLWATLGQEEKTVKIEEEVVMEMPPSPPAAKQEVPAKEMVTAELPVTKMDEIVRVEVEGEVPNITPRMTHRARSTPPMSSSSLPPPSCSLVGGLPSPMRNDTPIQQPRQISQSTPPPSTPSIFHNNIPTSPETGTPTHNQAFISPNLLRAQTLMHEAFRQMPMTPLEKLIREMKGEDGEVSFSDYGMGVGLETPGAVENWRVGLEEDEVVNESGDGETGGVLNVAHILKPVAELRLSRASTEKLINRKEVYLPESDKKIDSPAPDASLKHFVTTTIPTGNLVQPSHLPLTMTPTPTSSDRVTPPFRMTLEQPTPVQVVTRQEDDVEATVDEAQSSAPEVISAKENAGEGTEALAGRVTGRATTVPAPMPATNRQPLSAIHSAIAPIGGTQMRQRAQRTAVAANTSKPLSGPIPIHTRPITRPRTPPFARSKKPAPSVKEAAPAPPIALKSSKPMGSTIPTSQAPQRNARAGPSKSNFDSNRSTKPVVTTAPAPPAHHVKPIPSIKLAPNVSSVQPPTISPIPRKPSTVVKIPDFSSAHATFEAQRAKKLAQIRGSRPQLQPAPAPVVKVLTIPQCGRTPGRTSRVRMQERGEWDRANMEYQRKREEALRKYLEDKERAEIEAEEEHRKKIAFKANPVPDWLPRRANPPAA